MVIIKPYSDGVHTQDFKFDDEAQHQAWTSGWQSIKQLNAVINSNIKPNTSTKKSDKWHKDWLKKVDKFAEEFGEQRVPMDVIKAHGEIHKGIGLGEPKKRECLAIHLNGQGPYGLPHYTITYEEEN